MANMRNNSNVPKCLLTIIISPLRGDPPEGLRKLRSDESLFRVVEDAHRLCIEGRLFSGVGPQVFVRDVFESLYQDDLVCAVSLFCLGHRADVISFAALVRGIDLCNVETDIRMQPHLTDRLGVRLHHVFIQLNREVRFTSGVPSRGKIKQLRDEPDGLLVWDLSFPDPVVLRRESKPRRFMDEVSLLRRLRVHHSVGKKYQ